MLEQRTTSFRASVLELAATELNATITGVSRSACYRGWILRDLSQTISRLLDSAEWTPTRLEDFLTAALHRAENWPDWEEWTGDFTGTLTKISANPEPAFARKALERAIRRAPNQPGGGGWTGRDVDDSTRTVETLGDDGTVLDSHVERRGVFRGTVNPSGTGS